MQKIQTFLESASIEVTESTLDKKASSTGAFTIGSTITNPNVNSIIRAVAAYLCPQITMDPLDNPEPITNSDFYYFSEEKYIIENPEAYDEERKNLVRTKPTKENIFEFINALYQCAQFSPECCIICMIYIQRLGYFSMMPLYSSNWRPLVFCGLLVAQKVCPIY